MSWQQNLHDQYPFIQWSSNPADRPTIKIHGSTTDGVDFHETLFVEEHRGGPVTGILGRGGFAVVFLVATVTGERYVLKAVQPANSCNEHEERLRREQQFLLRVDHPNAVKILIQGFLICRDGVDRPAYLMEFVDYSNLGITVTAASPQNLPSSEVVLKVAIEICDVLAAFHDFNVTHRDVKPENLFFKMDAAGAVFVKLIDLGIAFDPSLPRMQDSVGGIGTRDFADYDQYCGRPTPRSDQFALGVLLYRWLTGKFPYLQCVDITSFVASVSQRDPQTGIDPEPAQKYHPAISDHLSHVLAKMLRRDSKLRFETMRDVQAHLQIALGKIPTQKVRGRDEWHPYDRVKKLIGEMVPRETFDRILREFDRLHAGMMFDPIRSFINSLSTYEAEAERIVGQRPAISQLFALQASFRGASEVFLNFDAGDTAALSEWDHSHVWDRLRDFAVEVRSFSKTFPSGPVVDSKLGLLYIKEIARIIRPMRRVLRDLDLRLRTLRAVMDLEMGLSP